MIATIGVYDLLDDPAERSFYLNLYDSRRVNALRSISEPPTVRAVTIDCLVRVSARMLPQIFGDAQ